MAKFNIGDKVLFDGYRMYNATVVGVKRYWLKDPNYLICFTNEDHITTYKQTWERYLWPDVTHD